MFTLIKINKSIKFQLHFRNSTNSLPKNITTYLERLNDSSRHYFTDPEVFPSDRIPSSSNLVSPFDVSTFGKQLIPLMNANIKEKVKQFAQTVDDLEDAMHDEWKESLLNPSNFQSFLQPSPIYHHLPPMKSYKKYKMPPAIHNKHKQQKYPKQFNESNYKHHVETYEVKGMMHDYGIDNYKQFQDNILKKLEKQEEQKAEATIHTFYEHGEVINGKPYDFDSGWKKVPAPTKTYETNDVSSQIISPLHTSIFKQTSTPTIHSGVSNNVESKFYDVDNFSDSIHSTYSVHEEGESKLKAVKTRYNNTELNNTKKYTSPVELFKDNVSTRPITNSRYRKRNLPTKKPVNENNTLPKSTLKSPEIINIYNKSKRNHIQSLTTSRPKTNYSNHYVAESQKQPVVIKAPQTTDTQYILPSVVLQSNLNLKNVRINKTRGTTTTTSTTIKPSRNSPRSIKDDTKFIDKPKVSGYRGSVKFGATKTN